MSKSLLLSAIDKQTRGDVAGAIKQYQSAIPGARWWLSATDPQGQRVFGPDFLIIGAARCGTSWLKKRLSGHRNVRILVGEPNYFSFNANLDPKTYVARWTSRDVKNADLPNDGSPRLCGEKSPSYLLMSHTKLSLLEALFPAVKIICMVRDPVDRAWSDIRRRTDNLDAIPDWPLIKRSGHYAEHIGRWAHHFEPARFHFVDFAELQSDPAAVYGDCLRFLSLGEPQADVNFPAAPSARPSVPADLRRTLEAEYEGESWRPADLRRLAITTWDKRVSKQTALERAAKIAAYDPGEAETSDQRPSKSTRAGQ